ncbi:hypothetical protein [Herbiconiux flava]|uniref:Asparagine synthetase domain-containing protein n=1 Tax=Herbiconiux flava TaxID=881268 RepID=A0A852SH11_9MICO|nr:hypothetical protein [Herbiconiux flava]NYD68874.1 hypothetical protein [Herbiconiux flava]GLK15616.1 hypothetical protein GCM10017602_00980 [Herbiconiux flava]
MHSTARPPMHDQFIITRVPRPMPEGFVTTQHFGWRCGVSPSLPVTEVRRGEIAVGWILGWVILEDGRFAHETGSFEISEPAPGDPDGVEETLYALAGRWACFLVVAGGLRVYVDPSASLGVVFSEEESVIASTTSIVNWGRDDSFGEGRYSRRVLKKNQFFPSGATSDPAIGRVLPDHRLDTSTWAVDRHWPAAPLARFTKQSEVDAATTEIATSTSAVMAALTSHTTTILPLTSGRDSRIIMSAVRDRLANCEFVTFEYHDFRKADTAYARAVVGRYGLRHRLLTIPTPDDDDRRTYLEAIGYDANEGKARDFYLAAGELPSDRGWVTGYVGEVGRGYFWRETDSDAIPATDDLLERMRLDHTPENTQAVEQWLETAVFADVPQMLDLLYQEQRQGAWASTQLYGAAPFVFSIIPLNTRRNIENMLRLPIAYVKSGQMPRDIARVGWPDLAELPYDRQPGWQGRLEYAAFILRRDGGRLFRRITRTKSR